MGRQIDRSCYKALIENVCKYGYYETAYMACKECVSEKWFADAFLSDLTTIKLLMHGLVRTSKYDIGRRLSELVENQGLQADIEFYNCSIQCLCALGRSAEAEMLLEGLEAKGLKPDATTYRHMISEFSKDGDMEGVSRLYLDMNEKGVEPDKYLYETISKCLYKFEVAYLCDSGETVEAKKFLERVPSMGLKLNADMYGYLIDAFAANGKLDDVRVIYEDMCEKDVKPTKSCYETLIKCLTQGGYYDTALEACENCKSEIWFLDVLNPIHLFFIGFSKISKHDDVLKVLDLSKKHGQHEEISICNSGIYVLCYQKKTAEANALFEAMVSRGIEPNAKTYADLISAFAGEGNAKEVMGLYSKMREMGIEPYRYTFENSNASCKVEIPKVRWSFASISCRRNGLKISFFRRMCPP